VERIYLDHNASTPVDPVVLDAVRPLFESHLGNPSSTHWAGRPAREAVDRARVQVAAMLGASPGEIVFTSGGSESNNHAIKGAFFRRAERSGAGWRGHIITSAVEHPAVLQPCAFLERLGARVTTLPVDVNGRVDPADLERAIEEDTLLVSVMHANNEVGTLQPIAELAAIARTHDVWFHCDAAQSVGKVATRVDELGVDMLSIAGHKFYAPKGVGALYLREGVVLEPLIHGAGHEDGRRAGTENVWLNAALGAACELARSDPPGERMRELRDHFWHALRGTLGERVVLNGHPDHCLPNTLNVSFLGCIGSELLASLHGVAASTGSACHEGQVSLSPVLAAMGVGDERGAGAIRFSLGRGNTRAQIDHLVAALERALTP
jgi:cysteine desulfurase